MEHALEALQTRLVKGDIDEAEHRHLLGVMRA